MSVSNEEAQGVPRLLEGVYTPWEDLPSASIHCRGATSSHWWTENLHQALVAEEGDSVDREGPQAVQQEALEEDPHPLLPHAHPHAVEDTAVLPPPAPDICSLAFTTSMGVAKAQVTTPATPPAISIANSIFGIMKSQRVTPSLVDSIQPLVNND
ncbi:hypothetical protein INR49_022209 [Caranx melampygus]|nr:hypothetical protein INR49_022209 [Caranx melampygus]